MFGFLAGVFDLLKANDPRNAQVELLVFRFGTECFCYCWVHNNLNPCRLAIWDAGEGLRMPKDAVLKPK